MRYLSLFMIFIISPGMFFLTAGCSSESSSKKRSNQTAVRVFHAGLDAIPVGFFLGEELIGETSYLANSVFTPVSPQNSILRLSRSTRYDEPVIEFPVELLPATEYSIFIFGEVKRGTFQVRLLEEPLIVPASGITRVQFLHALIDQGNVRFRINGMDDVTLGFGENSGFMEIPSGDHALTILDTSGRTVYSTSLSAPEQGELSILLAGKSSYNFVSLRVYEDFD